MYLEVIREATFLENLILNDHLRYEICDTCMHIICNRMYLSLIYYFNSCEKGLFRINVKKNDNHNSVKEHYDKSAMICQQCSVLYMYLNILQDFIKDKILLKIK